MRQLPKVNEIYRHFKGNCYRIVALAKETETGKTLVIYQALYGDNEVYARELEMFMSPVDREKYPDAPQEMRFELLDGKEAPPQVNSVVMDYLDAETYKDKLQILEIAKDKLTDDMINTMAVAIDVEIAEGDIAKRYEQLKYCLVTRERFECDRLR